jgi:hypothetical protein
MVSRTVDICKKYLSDEVMIPNYLTMGKNNTSKPVIMKRSIAEWLSYFVPDNIYSNDLRALLAGQMKKSCVKGYFDLDIWNSSDISQEIAYHAYESTYMLCYGNYINEDIQRIWLTYEWTKYTWYNDLPSDIREPHDPSFIFWLARLENLMDFSLFCEFMADKAAPYLYNLCERLSDKDDKITIKTNNYYYHQGQYTESPRNKQDRKNDLLLRVIRLLNKC